MQNAENKPNSSELNKKIKEMIEKKLLDRIVDDFTDWDHKDLEKMQDESTYDLESEEIKEDIFEDNTSASEITVELDEREDSEDNQEDINILGLNQDQEGDDNQEKVSSKKKKVIIPSKSVSLVQSSIKKFFT